MDRGIINPENLFLPRKGDKAKDSVTLAPTFYGEEYTDKAAYLKFNNAIERMLQPREVEHTEVDVEFVTRNEEGSLYAVVYHYPEGNTNSDMLIKRKNGGWTFYRYKIRFHPNFVNTYISSIYGYNRLTESQIAQEIVLATEYRSKMAIYNNYALAVFPGGIGIFKSAVRDGEIISIESIDFVGYESLERDKIKDIYQEMLSRFVAGKEIDIEYLPGKLIEETLAKSLERLKKKYGDKKNE